MGNGDDGEQRLPPLPPVVNGPVTKRTTQRLGIAPIQLLVVHAMAENVKTPDGEVFPALEWLTKDYPDLEEFWSADAAVTPQGVVHTLNPDYASRYSWHAGKSAWKDLPRHRSSLNHLSLGVEVLVEGTWTLAELIERMKSPEAYKPVQYRSTGWLLAKWADEFTLTWDAGVGHEKISGPDVRPDPKEDPGAGFDWQALHERFDQYREAYFGGSVK